MTMARQEACCSVPTQTSSRSSCQHKWSMLNTRPQCFAEQCVLTNSRGRQKDQERAIQVCPGKWLKAKACIQPCPLEDI